MVLSGTQVRPAVPGDVPDLVALCLEARDESTVGPQLCSSDAEVLADQLRTFGSSDGGTVLTGLVEGEVVGVLLARVSGPGLFAAERAVRVEAVFVSAAHRRRGVGHALIAELLVLAEAVEARHVYAVPLPGARGMQRFLARLGFAPAAAFRFASVAALQRRLAERSAVGLGLVRARGIERLIARRRVATGARGRVSQGEAAS